MADPDSSGRRSQRFPLDTVCIMAVVIRAAPIFPVRDLRTSLNHYQRLGFTVRETRGADTAMQIEMAWRSISALSALRTGAARSTRPIYGSTIPTLLAHEWLAVGAEVHMPEDTDWGKHEGAVVDPDGNVLRFGSPID